MTLEGHAPKPGGIVSAGRANLVWVRSDIRMTCQGLFADNAPGQKRSGCSAIAATAGFWIEDQELWNRSHNVLSVANLHLQQASENRIISFGIAIVLVRVL